jgi:hypothetical protein
MKPLPEELMCLSEAAPSSLSPEVARALTSNAHLTLLDTLQRHGNRLSGPHRAALHALCQTMTDFASGRTSGRKVFGLATGLGKTSALIAWTTSLYRMGAATRHISVAVSASTVEALCNIKRALIENGVPETLIGLKHSLGAAARLPSTGNDDRRIMLVTHQRVRTDANHQLFTEHRGKPRDLLLYDESLFRADALAVNEKAARSGLAWLEEWVYRRSEYDGLLAYLRKCREIIVAAVDEAREHKGKILTTTLPPLDEIERVGYTELLSKFKRKAVTESLGDLVALAGESLRVAAIKANNEGVLWHRVSVPKSLNRVLVLDASYPIRLLCQLDETLEPADRVFNHAEVKRFDNVTIHWLDHASGRGAMEDSFREKRPENRKVSREVVEIVKAIPPEENVLIFTFNTRDVDIHQRIFSDLKEAGVDIGDETRQRVNVLTWGNETSLNSMSHCQNVILAGVIHRSHLDIGSMVVGQLDDREADLGASELEELIDSEVAHAMYQALSRGKCREVDNGQAKLMKAWVFFPRKRQKRMQARLEKVMVGARHVERRLVHSAGGQDGVVDGLALRLQEHLKGLPKDIKRVSAKQIKRDLGITPAQRCSFVRAVDRLDSLSAGWVRDGRSLVRAETAYGFTAEG